MQIEIHSLSWENADPRLFVYQNKVFEFFGLPICQHVINIKHAVWMDLVIRESKSDVVVFFDNDCILLNKLIIQKCCLYAYQNNSFVGIAQVSNHIGLRTHVYAAPAFFSISKKCWVNLGMISFCETYRSDVAEELSWTAEERGLTYRALYPKSYERFPLQGKPWRLNNYGFFGVGTIFDGGIFHLYEGRLSANVDLFVDVSKKILSGNTPEQMKYSSKDFDFY